MSTPPDTFDHLWTRLGLDSLIRDQATLKETVRPDWESETVASQPGPPQPSSATAQTLRLSLTPPKVEGAPAEAEPDDLVVTGLLGEGGMGRVLLARQGSLGREVAIKVPRENAQAWAMKSLVEEARITGMLEHPGIIPVHSLASDVGGRPALVMKRVDGVSWETLLRDPKDRAWDTLAFSGDRVEIHVQILLQVCNALAFAHRRGVLHRDIKPANILIGEFGEVHVADWGVAAKKLKPGETARASLVGTPLYLAPEMVSGDLSRMDERTDVYLVGATLYQVLSGRPPHLAKTVKEALAAAFKGEVQPLPEGVPTELAAICLTCLAPRPEQRYPSAIALRDALAGFLRHRGAARLAEASQQRLHELERLCALPETTATQVYPLLSECRFGFMQALKDWPASAQARHGLAGCLTTAATFEVRLGNAAAARALLDQLETVPPELEAKVAALEEAARRVNRRDEALRSLARELDPRVSQAQRRRFFAVMGSVLVVAVVVPEFWPAARRFYAGVQPWALTVRSIPTTVVFLLALFLGRRSLLGTRINRRVAGLIGLCLVASIVLRVLGVVHGVSDPATLTANLVLLAAIGAAAALTFHWGFGAGGAVALLGTIACTAWPEHSPILFSSTTALSLVVIVATWGRWRSELAQLVKSA